MTTPNCCNDPLSWRRLWAGSDDGLMEGGYCRAMSDSSPGPLRRFSERLLEFGAYEGEDADQAGRRRIMVGTLWFSIPFVALAGLGEGGFWLVVATLFKPLGHALALVVLKLFPGSFRPAFRMVFAADLTTDLAVTFLVGGLFASGLQVGWSLIVVLGALVAFSVREAAVWFVVFAAAVVVSANTTEWVEPLYQLSDDPQADGAFTIIGVTILVFLVMAYFVRQRERYRRQSDDLLHNILPDEIATQLKEGSGMIADHFDAVTVLFADVVNFTPMSAEMTPTELVGLLNDVFTDIDSFVDEVGLEKIKTIGDEYMVAAGVPTPRADHAHVIADLALRIQDHVADKEFGGHPITFRIGINSGPVVAGVIGSQKFSYDLWGDVVNTASRMESTGLPGRIQITAATYDLLKGEFVCDARAEIDVKGKGAMETWLLSQRRPPDEPHSTVPGQDSSSDRSRT